MKNLILCTHHFWPETFQINSVAENLAKKKNIKLTVLTGLPNYPDGEIYKKYKKINKLYQENYKNINIYRCPVIPRKKGNALNLIINYLSFIIFGIIYFNKIKFKKKIDYILTYSTSPITSNLTAIFLKKKYNTKLAIWLQDIWPESVEATGHIKNKFILKIILLIVKYILKNADIIFVPSKGFIKNTFNKVKNKKIVYIPNSCFNNPKNLKNNLPKKLDYLLKKKKCFVYSGNIGKAQNISSIVDAAEKLKNKKNIFFIIIGNGSEKKNIQQKIQLLELKNILMIPQSSYDDVIKISTRASGLLITLENHWLFNLYIPNKFQNYLRLKIPILGSIDGEVAKIINKKKIGFACAPNNVNQFAKNIIKVSNLKSREIKKIRNNCKRLLIDEFSSKRQIEKILKNLI